MVSPSAHPPAPGPAARTPHPERILPKGDRQPRPPGRRQFRLGGLVWLLTIEAVVLSLASTAGLGPFATILAACLVVAAWWQYAEIRFPPRPADTSNDEAPREEIRRWKRGETV